MYLCAIVQSQCLKFVFRSEFINLKFLLKKIEKEKIIVNNLLHEIIKNNCTILLITFLVLLLLYNTRIG